MSYNDKQIKDAVDAAFKQYDVDNSNSLDASEITNFMNDALKYMKSDKKVSNVEVQQYIAAVDFSGDGKI